MKKGKNILLFLLVVIFIVGSASVGYYMGTNKQNNDTKTIDNNEDNKMLDENVDKLGRKLYNDTLFKYGWYDLYFYSNEKLTVDNMELDKKLEITMNNISFNDINYNQVKDLFSQECLKESTDSNGFNYTCYVYKVNKDIFAEVYYNLFNQNMPTFNYFIYMDSLNYRVCKLENQEIKCYPMDSGGDTFGGVLRMVRYSKTELKNNVIYVYADYIGFNADKNATNIFNVYSDYDLTKKIGNVDFYGDIDIFDDEDKYFQEFKGKTGQYKLTFKQNEYNNWYWESTEVVK